RTRGCRDLQSPQPIASEIGLVALGNQLFQSGSHAIAIENAVERVGGGLVAGATGKKITVAGGRVEQPKNFIELRHRGPLGRGLAAAVEVEWLREACRFRRAADGLDLRERNLLPTDAP